MLWGGGACRTSWGLTGIGSKTVSVSFLMHAGLEQNDHQGTSATLFGPFFCLLIRLLMTDIYMNQLCLKTLSDVCSPLMGANGGMHRYPWDRLPCTSVRFTPSPFLSISGNRAGSLGAAVAIRVIFAPTSPDPALWLADALAAAEPVDHVLGHRLIEALPVLLRDEYSGKHGDMRGKNKEQGIESGPRLKKRGRKHHRGTSSPQERTLELQLNYIWNNSDIQHMLKKINSEDQLNRIFKVGSNFNQQASTVGKARSEGRKDEEGLMERRYFSRPPRDERSLKGKICLRGETSASLSASWCLTAAAWDTTDRTQREEGKKCGSERAWDFSLSLCFHQNHLILALALLHFRPRFSSVSLSMWAQSRKLMTSVADFPWQSSQWIFILMIKSGLFFFFFVFKWNWDS